MKTRKTTAFYLESLLLTLFFLVLLTVLVRMFAAARGLGLQARQETRATLIAQNVCALLATVEPDGTAEGLAQALGGTVAAENTVQLRCSDSGVQEDNGSYMVTVTSSVEKTGAGRLFSYTVAVAEAGQTEPLIALETADYRPAKG